MVRTTEELNLLLPRDLAEAIRGKVQGGAYASDSKVIREALRLLQEHEGAKAQRLAWLREKIERSLADPWPSVDADEVFARLEERNYRRGEGDA